MRMKSKLFALVALLFAMALVAGACGNDDDDGASSIHSRSHRGAH